MRKLHGSNMVTRLIFHDYRISVANLAEMTAIGLGLPTETFRDAGKYGYVPLFPFFAATLILHKSPYPCPNCVRSCQVRQEGYHPRRVSL